MVIAGFARANERIFDQAVDAVLLDLQEKECVLVHFLEDAGFRGGGLCGLRIGRESLASGGFLALEEIFSALVDAAAPYI